MSTLKNFEEYEKIGIVLKITPNKERAKNLLLESERRMKSLDEKIRKIGVKEENANDYVEYCYDIIMYLIRSLLYLEGYKSIGKGAHQAEVSYLRKLNFNEKDIRFLDRLRYFRNGILYYGDSFDSEYAKKVITFTKKIIPILRNRIKI